MLFHVRNPTTKCSRAKMNICTCFLHKDKLRVLLSLHMMLNMKHNCLCCWRRTTVTVEELKFMNLTSFGLSVMLRSHRMMKLTAVCEDAFWALTSLWCLCLTSIKHFEEMFLFSWGRKIVWTTGSLGVPAEKSLLLEKNYDGYDRKCEVAGSLLLSLWSMQVSHLVLMLLIKFTSRILWSLSLNLTTSAKAGVWIVFYSKANRCVLTEYQFGKTCGIPSGKMLLPINLGKFMRQLSDRSHIILQRQRSLRIG